MLKHVHISSCVSSSHSCRTPARDTVSLSSTLTSSSTAEHGPLSSRSSSTSSLRDASLLVKPPKIVVKVYVRALSNNLKYRTLSVGPQTTCREIVCALLNKFRMKHRDPNLYCLSMEVWIRGKGLPIRTVMVLDDEARPSELQACHPCEKIGFLSNSPSVCKFVLQMRRGGLVKVFDSCLMTGSMYKSLLVSDKTTTEELIQLLLHCYNSKERPNKFALFQISSVHKYETKIHPKDHPLLIQRTWPSKDHFAFHLRRNPDCFQRRRGKWDTGSSLCYCLYI